MIEMVEAVARALCKEIGIQGDGLIVDHRLEGDRVMPCWKHQLPKARAAIAVTGKSLADAFEAGDDWIIAEAIRDAINEALK